METLVTKILAKEGVLKTTGRHPYTPRVTVRDRAKFKCKSCKKFHPPQTTSGQNQNQTNYLDAIEPKV